MNTQNRNELSDAQLDTISGGSCYRPEPPKGCYGKDYDKDYDKDYGKDYDYKGCWKGWNKYFEDHKDYNYGGKY